MKTIQSLIKAHKGLNKIKEKDTSAMSLRAQEAHDLKRTEQCRLIRELTHKAHCRAVEAGIADTYPEDYYGDKVEKPHGWHKVITTYERPNSILEEAIDALRFYADPSKKLEDGKPVDIPDFYGEMEFGERAQEVLNKIKTNTA